MADTSTDFRKKQLLEVEADYFSTQARDSTLTLVGNYRRFNRSEKFDSEFIFLPWFTLALSSVTLFFGLFFQILLAGERDVSDAL